MAYTFNNPFIQIETISIQGTLIHSTQDTTFLMILRGELQVSLNKQILTLEQEDLMMIMTESDIEITGKGGDILLLIRMRNDFFAQGKSKYIGTYICNSILDNERDYAPLRRLLSQIALNAKYSSTIQKIKTAELAYSLLFYLNNYHYTLNLGTDNKDKYQERNSIILSYLEGNYMNPITLEALAKLTYLTPTYLSRFFKNQMGANFNEYLRQFRLKHAVEELLTTDNKIIDIAINNGFSNVTWFNKIFQNKYHTTPQQYRLKHSTDIILDVSPFHIDQENLTIAKNQLQAFSSVHTENDEFLYPGQEKHFVKDAQKSRIITPIWKQAINIGFIESLDSSIIQSQLAIAQREIGFKYGRIQGVLNNSVLSFLKNGNFNFSFFDRYIQMMLGSKGQL